MSEVSVGALRRGAVMYVRLQAILSQRRSEGPRAPQRKTKHSRPALADGNADHEYLIVIEKAGVNCTHNSSTVHNPRQLPNIYVA